MKTQTGAISVLLFALLILSLQLSSCLAATRTWDGGGTDNNWTTATNWVGDIAPLPGDDLVFPASAAQLSNSNNFPAGTGFNSISFTGEGYTIGGSNLVLAAGITAQS